MTARHFLGFVDVWDAGYQTRRDSATRDAVDKRPSWAVLTPDGKLLGYGHSEREVCRLAARHANGWGR